MSSSQMRIHSKNVLFLMTSVPSQSGRTRPVHESPCWPATGATRVEATMMASSIEGENGTDVSSKGPGICGDRGGCWLLSWACSLEDGTEAWLALARGLSRLPQLDRPVG